MEIRHWMTRHLHALKPRDSVAHARELLEQYRVNQLPVVVDGRLVGIITDRDVRDASPPILEAIQPTRRPPRKKPPLPASSDPSRIEVEMIMTPEVVTLGPADSLEAAAQMMRRERLGSLPIVDGGRLLGLITRSDILDAFLSLSEATKGLFDAGTLRRSQPQ